VIESLVGELFLRAVPEHLREGVRLGTMVVNGGTVRRTNGQLAGFLQETSVFPDLLGGMSPADLTPPGMAAKVLNLGVDVVGHTASFVQNEQIKAGIETLKTMATAGLALNVASIGVSIAGFAVLSAKIGRVEAKVDAMAEQLGAIGRKIDMLRKDRVDEDLTRLRTAAEQMEEGWSLSDPAPQWRDVASEAHRLANQFERRAAELLGDDKADPLSASPFLEAMALAGATRVSARLAAGEDVAARGAAGEGAAALAKLGRRLNLSELALTHLKAQKIEPGTAEWGQALGRSTDALRPGLAAVREREASAAGTALTLTELDHQEIRGRAWLEAARSERESPLLCLLPRQG
jgi:hypothetical protein